MNKPPSQIVIDIVAEVTGIPSWKIKGPGQTADVVRARTMAIWVIKRVTPLTYPQIGRAVKRLGDHHTVKNSLNRAEAFLKTDPAFNREARLSLERAQRNPGVTTRGFKQITGRWSPQERAAAGYLDSIGRTPDQIAWIMGRKVQSVAQVLMHGSAHWPPRELGPLSADPDENEALIAQIFKGQKFEDIKLKSDKWRESQVQLI